MKRKKQSSPQPTHDVAAVTIGRVLTRIAARDQLFAPAGSADATDGRRALFVALANRLAQNITSYRNPCARGSDARIAQVGAQTTVPRPIASSSSIAAVANIWKTSLPGSVPENVVEGGISYDVFVRVRYTDNAQIGGDFILEASVTRADTGAIILEPNSEDERILLDPAPSEGSPFRRLITAVRQQLSRADFGAIVSALRSGKRIKVSFIRTGAVVILTVSIGCAVASYLYRLSLDDVAIMGVACATSQDKGQPQWATKPGYIVLWFRGKHQLADYFVLRDGHDITDKTKMVTYPIEGQDVCLLADDNVELGRTYFYRVGFGSGLSRKVSAAVSGDAACLKSTYDEVRSGRYPVATEDIRTAKLDSMATAYVGEPRRLSFPFVKKTALGQSIDIKRADELAHDLRVLVDFGDNEPDSKVMLSVDRIIHTYRRVGKFEITAVDPSSTSGQAFTSWIEVIERPKPLSLAVTDNQELCAGEATPCFVLPLHDVPREGAANLGGAARFAARANLVAPVNTKCTFVLTLDELEDPWQYARGSMLVKNFGDGSHMTTGFYRFDGGTGEKIEARGPVVPHVRHTFTTPGTYEVRFHLVDYTGWGVTSKAQVKVK